MKRRKIHFSGLWVPYIMVLMLALGTSACSEQKEGGDKDHLPHAYPEDSDAPLSSLDDLMTGAPSNEEIPEGGKADAIYPSAFDLADYQSPVRSQGSRGVCSIFSAVALMEHLYIREGTMPNPNFSEQFLQWSVKAELGDFVNTEGSNARSNIRAINLYGIVMEQDHPYETFPWGVSHDERCTGDDRPRVCYTNGDPPESALQARRWKLPPGRWVNSRTNSIKAFMTENQQGVVAGMTFFYQSWNHRLSDLPTNSNYWSEGYVLYPNAVDKEKSLEKRAGHSILLIGWDDDLEVDKVDENGAVKLDDDGNPITEKGFWVFKNSWGTTGFGIRNPFGAGYGYLSMRYVEEYATIYGSNDPSVELIEICDDGMDNNFNGLTDCEDPECADHPACIEGGLTFKNNETIAIPDNDPQGITSVIEVGQPGIIGNMFLDVDITHTYVGDLTVTLVGPDNTRVVLHNREGGSQRNLKKTYTPAGFVGKSIEGTWTLEITDTAAADTGQLNSWSITFQLTGDVPEEICDNGIDDSGNGLIDCADPSCSDFPGCSGTQTITETNNTQMVIPDNDPDGIESTIEISAVGAVLSLAVDVDITHTFRSDLIVSLIHPDGEEVILFNQEGMGGENLVRRFTPTELIGFPATGTWTLKVVDGYMYDEGTLNSWSIEMEVQ